MDRQKASDKVKKGKTILLSFRAEREILVFQIG
jgi:hypothetical protein